MTATLGLERNVATVALHRRVYPREAQSHALGALRREEQLERVARDAGVGLQVTSSDLRPGALAEGVRVVCVDRDADAIASEAPRRPAEPAGGEAPAYVIYTSGSTGLPKGVLVPHRAVLNHSLDVIKHFGLAPADRVLQFATVGFDAAVEEIFPTLLSGAGAVRLVVVGGEQASAPSLTSWRALVGTRVRWINTYEPSRLPAARPVRQDGFMSDDRQRVLDDYDTTSMPPL